MCQRECIYESRIRFDNFHFVYTQTASTVAVFLSDKFTGDMSSWDVSRLTARELCDVEADCYWCLCKVLDSIQDHYTFAQPGIQKICFRLSEVTSTFKESTKHVPLRLTITSICQTNSSLDASTKKHMSI